jgi:hypothetical protein
MCRNGEAKAKEGKKAEEGTETNSAVNRVNDQPNEEGNDEKNGKGTVKIKMDSICNKNSQKNIRADMKLKINLFHSYICPLKLAFSGLQLFSNYALIEPF